MTWNPTRMAYAPPGSDWWPAEGPARFARDYRAHRAVLRDEQRAKTTAAALTGRLSCFAPNPAPFDSMSEHGRVDARARDCRRRATLHGGAALSIVRVLWDHRNRPVVVNPPAPEFYPEPARAAHKASWSCLERAYALERVLTWSRAR